MSPETEQQAIELYKEHDSCRIVGEILGTCGEQVRRVLIKYNIPRKGNRESCKREKQVFISNCRTKHCPALVGILHGASGMSACEIASTAGIPKSAVHDIFQRRGFSKKQNRVNKCDVDIEAIEREYLDGASTYELGSKYGVTHETISKWMRQRGHHRGRRKGPAVEAWRKNQHEEAVKRLIDTFGDIPIEYMNGVSARKIVRKSRIKSKRQDKGINWRSLAERNGNIKCEICGIECDPKDKTWGTCGPTHPSVDHITCIADGGTDTWDNVRLSCCACNLKLNAERTRRVRHAKEQVIAR